VDGARAYFGTNESAVPTSNLRADSYLSAIARLVVYHYRELHTVAEAGRRGPSIVRSARWMNGPAPIASQRRLRSSLSGVREPLVTD
jgi:hypothetical protein